MANDLKFPSIYEHALKELDNNFFTFNSKSWQWFEPYASFALLIQAQIIDFIGTSVIHSGSL